MTRISVLGVLELVVCFRFDECASITGNAWVIGAYMVCIGEVEESFAPEMFTEPFVTAI